jgi:hypothetical protein
VLSSTRTHARLPSRVRGVPQRRLSCAECCSQDDILGDISQDLERVGSMAKGIRDEIGDQIKCVVCRACQLVARWQRECSATRCGGGVVAADS